MEPSTCQKFYVLRSITRQHTYIFIAPGPKTRFPEGGYPADIRRKSGGYPAEIRRISALRRSPPDGFSVTSRMRAGASLSPLVGTGRRVATAGLVVPAPARHHSPPCSNQWGERCARDVTENPSGGLLRRADIRRISAGYPPSGKRVLGAAVQALKQERRMCILADAYKKVLCAVNYTSP